MEHCAIDLGGRESQICVRAADGTITLETRVATKQLGEWLQRRPMRVVLETCAETFAVTDLAVAAGHDVRVVPASLTRVLGVGARRTKTDRRDARALSEASCRVELPSVHVPSSWSRELKAQLGARDVLVRARTTLLNSTRSALRMKLQALRGRRTRTLPALVRAVDETPMPHRERVLQSIEMLTTQIEAATAELKALAATNEVCVRLMTAPGVGTLTALRFVATIDDVTRFEEAAQVASYLGLAPGEDSSSDRKRITSITKAGSPQMRWLLVQACWVALRRRQADPLCVWARQVKERRGARIAVIAMARKLSGILYALWRDGTTYQPHRAAETA